MSDYLLVFQSKFGLKKLLLSVFNKIKNNEIVSLRLCKKVALALANKDLIPQYWWSKLVLEVPVNLTGKDPMLSILVNDMPATCILDTDRTFTLQMHHQGVICRCTSPHQHLNIDLRKPLLYHLLQR